MPSPPTNQASTPVFSFDTSGGGLRLEDNDLNPFSKARELSYETMLLSRAKLSYRSKGVQVSSAQHPKQPENETADPAQSSQSTLAQASRWMFRDMEAALANSSVCNLPPFRGMIAYFRRGLPHHHSGEDGFSQVADEDTEPWYTPEFAQD